MNGASTNRWSAAVSLGLVVAALAWTAPAQASLCDRIAALMERFPNAQRVAVPNADSGRNWARLVAEEGSENAFLLGERVPDTGRYRVVWVVDDAGRSEVRLFSWDRPGYHADMVSPSERVVNWGEFIVQDGAVVWVQDNAVLFNGVPGNPFVANMAQPTFVTLLQEVGLSIQIPPHLWEASFF